MFGRISQKGPNKRWIRLEILRPNFGRFLTKKAEKGPNFNKTVSLLLSSLFIGKCPRNIVIFPLTKANICCVFLKPKFLQKGKINEGPNFFPQLPNSSSGLAEKFCKELATLLRELTCETHIVAAEKVPPLLLGQRVGTPEWQLHTLVNTLPHPAAAAAAVTAVAVSKDERGGSAAKAQLPRNMTGGERVVTCYHGHLEKKTIFF